MRSLSAIVLLACAMGCDIAPSPAKALRVCSDGAPTEFAQDVWTTEIVVFERECDVTVEHDPSIAHAGIQSGNRILIRDAGGAEEDIFVAHEVGHALGYAHSDDPCDVMHPRIGGGNADCIRARYYGTSDIWTTRQLPDPKLTSSTE